MTPLQQAEARLWMLVREETPFVRVGDIESVLSELARLCAEVARLRVVDDGMVELALLAHRKEATRTRNRIIPTGIKFDDYQSWVRHDAMRAALEAAMGRG